MREANGAREHLTAVLSRSLLASRIAAEEEAGRLKLDSDKLQRELEALAAELKGIEERREEVRTGEDFGAEFDALLRNDKIADIDINQKGILVLTTQLCIPFRGKRYWIDPVRIEINFDGEGGEHGHGHVAGIKVVKSHEEQKVSPRGYPGEGPNWVAPHVRGNGSICLGNIHNDVARAMREHCWARAIELLFPFLESCSDDHEAYFHVLKNVAVRVEDEAELGPKGD